MIQCIDGKKFRDMFVSGANNLQNNKDLVDKYKDSDEYTEVLEGYLWYFQYNFSNEYLANKNINYNLLK